jgi:hypothetical protein
MATIDFSEIQTRTGADLDAWAWEHFGVQRMDGETDRQFVTRLEHPEHRKSGRWPERSMLLMANALKWFTENQWERWMGDGDAHYREHGTGGEVAFKTPAKDRDEAARLAADAVMAADEARKIHRVKHKVDADEPPYRFEWRGEWYPSPPPALSLDTAPREVLIAEAARIGRDKMIDALMLQWERGGGAMPRVFAERRVDEMAAEVGAMMAQHLAVCAGWETAADMGAIKKRTLGTSEPWTLVCDDEDKRWYWRRC